MRRAPDLAARLKLELTATLAYPQLSAVAQSVDDCSGQVYTETGFDEAEDDERNVHKQTEEGENEAGAYRENQAVEPESQKYDQDDEVDYAYE